MPRVTTKGQVTIPKDIREAIGIEPGDEVAFERTESGYEIRKEAPTAADGSDPFEKYRGSAEGEATMPERMRRLRDDQLKRQMHNWAFRELQAQIAYKAAEYGIRVESVNPAFSSQTCSKCGHQSSTNRDSETGWFACNECGYEVDGDYNAAKNVGLRLVALPSGKRPDGLGTGQLALKSGTLNVSDTSSVYSSLEFERESTDKSTASAVGS